MKKMKRVNYKVPKYVIQLLTFSIIVTVLTIVVQKVIPLYATPAMPFIVLFFFFISLFSLYVVLRDEAKRESRKFVSGYMVSRTVKLLACILFLLIYFFANKSDRWNFAIAFIIIYFLFSVCEVFIIKKENSRLQKQQEERLKAMKQSAENGREDKE